jgi:hypothetical protein
MRTTEQVYLEAQDHLERKLEKLHAEKLFIEQEIERTKELLKTIPDIYERE